MTAGGIHGSRWYDADVKRFPSLKIHRGYEDHCGRPSHGRRRIQYLSLVLSAARGGFGGARARPGEFGSAS